jgi:acyl-coenzyme A synthetase/AMP-(fatty) acid ligase
MPAWNSKEAIPLIEEYFVNSITSVPTMIAQLVEEKELLAVHDLHSVKHIVMASAPVSQHLYFSIKETFPEAHITIAYGSTEAGPGLFGRHPNLPTPPMSVGYPIAGIDYRLVDNILEVRSPSMLLKYTNTDSRLTDDGYFITNDIFRVDEDGFYYFIGRADDMFVSGGNNIYPRQVETVLEECPYVSVAAVVGVDDHIKGTKPYAFVVLSIDTTEDTIKQYAFDNLAPSACPRKIWTLDSMPLNSIGKIDKAKLKEQAIKLLYNV